MRTVALLLTLLAFVPQTHAGPAYPPQSIYHLSAALTDQSGRSIGLDVHRGQPVLVTMFYASCPMTCPLLIDTLHAIERALPPQRRSEVRVLMISIDPARDTPEQLLALARARRLDLSRWTLARAEPDDVRKIAALLRTQYRQLPDGNFNHSNVISLLSAQGEILLQSSVLGKADEALVEKLTERSHAGAPAGKLRQASQHASGRGHESHSGIP
jgi:protein SCO1/2